MEKRSPLNVEQPTDPIERQNALIALEQAATMIGVLLMTLGMLEVMGRNHDNWSHLLVLGLGMMMNVLCSIVEEMKGRHLMVWLYLFIAFLCLAGILFMLLY